MMGWRMFQKMSRFQAHYNLPDIASVAVLAQKIAPHLKRGDVLQLEGDLGVGKTTFTRALIAALAGKEIEVPSPTFTLVQQYEFPAFTLYHFDLYRLKNSGELLEIGLEQALSEGVTVLEWPQLATDFLPADSLVLKLSFSSGEGRQAELHAPAAWAPLLS